MPRLFDVLLPTKVAAALCGLPVQSLKQARCTTRRSARADLFTPTPTYLGPRRVRYSLRDLLLWSRLTGRPLRWDACPLSVALPAAGALADAGLELPEALQARAGRLATHVAPDP